MHISVLFAIITVKLLDYLPWKAEEKQKNKERSTPAAELTQAEEPHQGREEGRSQTTDSFTMAQDEKIR